MIRFLTAAIVLLVACPAFGQAFCPASDIAPSSIDVPVTYTQTTYQPVTETKVGYVRYVPQSFCPATDVCTTQVFDVDCALKIGREFLECTETATTRRQRFRCALTAIVNNADCLFSQTTTVSNQCASVNVPPTPTGPFKRLKMRRQARQMARQ